MDEYLVYESLTSRLLDNCLLLSHFCDEIFKSGETLSLHSSDNVFEELFVKSIELVDSCFIKNNITCYKIGAMSEILKIVDKTKSVSFESSVVSNLVVDDFVIPEIRGGYLKLYNDFISNVSCLKDQLLKRASESIDFLLTDYKRDLRRFSSMSNDGFDLKRSARFMTNYSKFMNSIRDCNHELLFRDIDLFDLVLIGDDNDNVCKIINGVPKSKTNKIAKVIKQYNYNIISLIKSYLPNDLLHSVTISFIDYSSDLKSVGKLSDDVSNLWI